MRRNASPPVRSVSCGPAPANGSPRPTATTELHSNAACATRWAISRRSADQSDGRIILRVTGPRVRDALAKGVPIDLHPRAFRPGDAAITTVATIGVHLWQVDDAPTYELIVPRSFAVAFREWFDEAAAEFGIGWRI